MDLPYRDKLNFDDNLTFGVEIEYGNADSDKIIKKIKGLPYKNCNKNYYDSWNYTPDYSFTKSINNHLYGGEVKSPIMKNTAQDFYQIRKVCEYLKKYNATVDDRMGLHVHVDSSVLEKDTELLIKFLKLYALYEHVIYKFSYNGANPRQSIQMHADYCKDLVLQILNSIRLNDEFLDTVRKMNMDILAKKHGINFANINDFELATNTIEFRMFNPSLDPVIIQNAINLVCNLLLSAKKELDMQYLDYKLKQKRKISFEEYSKIYMQDAQDFCNIIFDNDIDKTYFMRQYLKQ